VASLPSPTMPSMRAARGPGVDSRVGRGRLRACTGAGRQPGDPQAEGIDRELADAPQLQRGRGAVLPVAGDGVCMQGDLPVAPGLEWQQGGAKRLESPEDPTDDLAQRPGAADAEAPQPAHAAARWPSSSTSTATRPGEPREPQHTAAGRAGRTYRASNSTACWGDCCCSSRTRAPREQQVARFRHVTYRSRAIGALIGVCEQPTTASMSTSRRSVEQRLLPDFDTTGEFIMVTSRSM
jgi:hypothetical protein